MVEIKTNNIQFAGRKGKIAFATLGCKLNYSESSSLLHRFTSNGYLLVKESEVADIYVVNTCSVTEHAHKKCRNIIRKMHRQNPDAFIAVIGCYAQLKPEEVMAIEGVNLVLGADRKGDLYELTQEMISMQKGQTKEPVSEVFSCDIDKVSKIFPAYSSGERTRSFLKVQDGCNYKCSYCTIPYARGNSRNLPISVLVDQAREIAEKGIKEIVITGVNTGDFGKTTGEKFIDLLKALNEVDGIERYRISSIEPNLLSAEIVDWIASGTKFMPHFHIPLQSGSDKILAVMRRRYNTARFNEKIQMVRQKMEKEGGLKVFFGIDLIVGFPGETDAEFEETYHFLKDVVKPSFVHVFPYSIRPGTPAASMPGQVDERVKKERVDRLTALSEELYEAFVEENKGLSTTVLFEQKATGGTMTGYTENYIKISHPYDKSLIGKIVPVVIS